jgi:hypothetical protein
LKLPGFDLAELIPCGFRLKTPYRDGSTRVVFEPLDFVGVLVRGEKPGTGGDSASGGR